MSNRQFPKPDIIRRKNTRTQVTRLPSRAIVVNGSYNRSQWTSTRGYGSAQILLNWEVINKGIFREGPQTFVMNPELMDFREFPLKQYYNEQFGAYASSLKMEGMYKIEDIVKCIQQVPKGDLHIEDIAEHYDTEDTKHLFYNSIVFDIPSRQMAFIVRFIQWVADDAKTKFFKENAAADVNISCLYPTNQRHEDVFRILREEIFNVPELTLPKNEASGDIHVMVQSQQGFATEKYPLKPEEVNLALNYNDCFEQEHEFILSRLSEDKSKGLVLLHGAPGTGKTSYLRYLISKLKKKVIFIPPNLVNSLSDPGLIKFLLNNSNSILVIEDAESALTKHATERKQSVANILNLTDGLLSDCASIQIIATFNTEISQIDDALLRKGRLISKYEFKPLESHKIPPLVKTLGLNVNDFSYQKSMTLSDIYNHSGRTFSNRSRKEIKGFGQ